MKILAVLNDINYDYSILEKINVAVHVSQRNSSVCKAQEDNSERFEVHSCLKGIVLELVNPESIFLKTKSEVMK